MTVLFAKSCIAVSKGGANDLSNLQLLCAACNPAKADRI